MSSHRQSILTKCCSNLNKKNFDNNTQHKEFVTLNTMDTSSSPLVYAHNIITFLRQIYDNTHNITEAQIVRNGILFSAVCNWFTHSGEAAKLSRSCEKNGVQLTEAMRKKSPGLVTHRYPRSRHSVYTILVGYNSK